MSVATYIVTTIPRQFWMVFIVTAIVAWMMFTRIHYKLPPMPHSLPIVGNMFSMPKNKSLYLFSKEWSEEINEPVIRLRFGLIDAVVLNDDATIHEALYERAEDFAGRPHFTIFDLVSDGFDDVTSADISPKWKTRRKLMMAALRTFSVGDRYEERIQVVWKRVADVLDKRAIPAPGQEATITKGETAFDPSDIAKLLVYNYMAAVCYCQKLELDNPDFIILGENFDEGTRFFVRSRLSADMLVFLKYLPFDMPDVARARNVFTNVFNYCYVQLAEHIKNFQTENVRDFTDHLLKAKLEAQDQENNNIISKKQLGLIINNVFTAGAGTQTTVIIWIFYLIAMHQDKQQKAYEEICTLLEVDQQPCSKDRYRLTYCEACVNECIRFGTILIGLPRKAMVDTQVGGYDVPKGTIVYANHGAVHFDEKLWGDPEIFRPERFLVNGVIVKPKYFLPFGLGRRQCAGESAAKSTMFLFFVLLIRRYKISPPASQELKFEYDEDMGTPKPFTIDLERRQT